MTVAVQLKLVVITTQKKKKKKKKTGGGGKSTSVTKPNHISAEYE